MWEFVDEEDKISEQKIRFKGDVYVRGGTGANFFAYLFHCWYYIPIAIFSPWILSHAYHVGFQLVKNIY